MTNTINRSVAAVVFACLSFASPGLAQQRELVHVRVSHAGLDLATPEGRAILSARIRAAASNACTSTAMGMNKEFDERRCRNEMMQDGAAQIAALTGHRDVELAAVRR